MAGYRPQGKGLTPKGGGAGRKAAQRSVEAELLKAASAHARANDLAKRGASPRAVARATEAAEAHAASARKLSRRSARSTVARASAKGALRMARGLSMAAARSGSSYLGAKGQEGEAEAGSAAKAALASLGQDATFGAGSVSKGLAQALGGTAAQRLRASHDARRALSHAKGIREATLDKAGVWATDKAQRRSANVRKRTARVQRRAALRSVGIKSGSGSLPRRLARAASSALFVPMRAFRSLSGVGRLLWGVVALLGGSAAIALFIPLVIAVSVTTMASTAAAAGSGASASSSATITAYVSQAKAYAADDSIGYSQATRYHNPNMDCSSLVWYALVDSGCFSSSSLGNSPFTTFTMGPYLTSVGFQEIPFSEMGQTDADGDGAPDALQFGDILVNTQRHTEIYVGGGQNVGAHSDRDGRNGDGDGREVSVASYWNDQWDFVYRLPASSDVAASAQGVWSWLKSQGYSDAAAAAIMGNAQQESSMDPADIQGGGSGPAAGLFQWESYKVSGTRWGNLASYAASKGKDWTDMACQLEFMQQELSQQLGASGLATFKSGTDVDALTEQFEVTFERAGIPMMSNRISYARQFLNQFGGTS